MDVGGRTVESDPLNLASQPVSGVTSRSMTLDQEIWAESTLLQDLDGHLTSSPQIWALVKFSVQECLQLGKISTCG